MHFKTEEDYKAWVATQEKGAIGGGLLTSRWRRLCWSYSSHSCGFYILKRALVMKCVKPLPYVLRIISSFAKDHLTWLWQGEPPQGESTSNTFDKVKPIRKIF